jgi:hypothetical protein
LSRNKDRIGGTHSPDTSVPPNLHDEGQDGGGFSFVVPTEFVDLPSKGAFYPPNHPLHNCDSIEIKQMTAKEEDILTSKTLLKKGVALERVISSIIVDKRIRASTLLTGDRNALIIAARVSAYGNMYETKVACPACAETQEYAFDLNHTHFKTTIIDSGIEVTNNNDGTFTTELPRTKLLVTFRLMTGIDEKQLTDGVEADRKTRNQHERGVSRMLRGIMVAVNGNETAEAINYTVENIPSIDARHLRLSFKQVNPDIDMQQHFECQACGHEGQMEVPLTADFFWPDR